jgi:penicillin-binding protein 1B
LFVAGKTGTSDQSKDLWFAGFTPDLLAVVWTGFDKKEELGLTGAQAALPIWTTYMKAATASRPVLEFSPPPGLVVEKVDPANGCRSGPFCPGVEGVFPKAMEPAQPCNCSSTLPVTAGDHEIPTPDEPND